MPNDKDAESYQRILGYACIFTRSIDEASASMVRVITATTGGVPDGPETWLARIEGWLGDSAPLRGLSFGGASFSEAEWREILSEVVLVLRRDLPE